MAVCLCVCVSPSARPPLLSAALALCSRSRQLSLALLTPSPPSSLPAPPSARPLPPSRLPRRGSRARAPLRPGLGAPAPRRLAARGAGARRSSDALQRRRRHGGGGGAGERWPRGELRRWLPLLCRLPFPALTCCLGRKLTGSPPLRLKPTEASAPSSSPGSAPPAALPRRGRAAPSNPHRPCPWPRLPEAWGGSAKARGRGVQGARAIPGAWGGRALEKPRLNGPSLARGLHPPRADSSLAREPKQSVSPKAQEKRRTPYSASLQRPRAACPPRSVPAQAYTCALHAEPENFPLTPQRRSPSRLSFPIRLPSPSAGKRLRFRSALTASSRAGEPAGTPLERSGGGSHPTPARAPRNRPGPGLCWG